MRNASDDPVENEDLSGNNSLYEGDALDLVPGEELILPFSHCLTDLVYPDGARAPDEEFHYSIRLQFETQADREALLSHPETEEIYNTMQAFLQSHADEDFARELERDWEPVYTEQGLAGPDSLTPGTIGDMEFLVKDMITIINESYGTDIKDGTVSSGAQQVQGCGPSGWVLPENIADNNAPAVTGPAPPAIEFKL